MRTTARWTALAMAALAACWRAAAHAVPGGGMAHADALAGETRSREVELVASDEDSGEFEVRFTTRGALGLQFRADLSVLGFARLDGGRLGVAEKSGLVMLGDTLVAVNGDDVQDLSTSDAFQVLAEAARDNENLGRERVFRFRRGSGRSAAVRLSEQAAAESEGFMEHLDVYGLQDEELAAVRGLLAENLGTVPRVCKRRRIVFVKPADGCAEELRVERGEMKGALAVVVRGKCSYYHKARMVQAHNASGLLVVNNEDRLVRMRMEELMSNDVHIPAMMISSVDGSFLRDTYEQLAAHAGRSLEARLVASEECYAEESRELALEALRAEQPRETLQRLVPRKDESIGPRHRLYGVLAAAGRLHAVEPGQVMWSSASVAADFLAARFSGPLPVGEALRINDFAVGGGGRQPVLVLLRSWNPGTLVEKLIHTQREARVRAVAIVAPGTGIWHLEGALPSPLRIAVIMVSQQGSERLEAAMRAGQEVLFEPMHQVEHRWRELNTVLANPAAWPSEPRARSRLLARLRKRLSTSAEAGQNHVSECWTKHLATLRDEL